MGKAAPHVVDSHDLIRVQGARQNNLEDVSLEIPKKFFASGLQRRIQ